MSVTSALQWAASYFRFLSRSTTKYGVHSPFVYDLITKVFQDRHDYPEYKLAEEIRRLCLRNQREIEISDSGSLKYRMSPGNELKKVGAIRTAMTQRTGRLLHRLVKYLAPENILELGTPLGISTIYMASAAPEADFWTMQDGSTSAELAKENLMRAGLPHVHQLTGDFSHLLPRFVAGHQHIGFVFFDGIFTGSGLLAYFNQCLPLCGLNSVLVFHNIHGRDGLQEAWDQICRHPRVTVSIDLFDLGMIFFRKGLSKQDFAIRF